MAEDNGNATTPEPTAAAEAEPTCATATLPSWLSLGSAAYSGRLLLIGRGLTEVPASSLTPDLRAIDLSENCLSSLKLPAMQALMELRLADNALDSIAVQRASPLPAQLRVLDLGANRLTLLPPCVLRLRSLLTLKVDRQQLRALPPELSLLSALVELDAGFNELERALPLAAPGLPALRRLVLRSNGLTSDAVRRAAPLIALAHAPLPPPPHPSTHRSLTCPSYFTCPGAYRRRARAASRRSRSRGQQAHHVANRRG
jgi:hypothetical protein